MVPAFIGYLAGDRLKGKKPPKFREARGGTIIPSKADKIKILSTRISGIKSLIVPDIVL